MAYDEVLANRVRHLLGARDDVEERKMFGGIAFMVGGRMALGVLRDDLIVRVGAPANDEALSEPFTRPFDFTHRPARGTIYVAPEGVSTDTELARWVARGVDAVPGAGPA